MKTIATDELRTRLTALLGVSLDTPDAGLLEHVSGLCALRQRLQADAALEAGISTIQKACNCGREIALNIIKAQGA
jgi:hypothetical protein